MTIMQYNLRDYQKKAVEAAVNFFNSKKQKGIGGGSGIANGFRKKFCDSRNST